jgi:DnaJ-class molecular chaperone
MPRAKAKAKGEEVVDGRGGYFVFLGLSIDDVARPGFVAKVKAASAKGSFETVARVKETLCTAKARETYLSVWCTANYYDMFGLARDAPAADVTKAFRAMALRTHPDRWSKKGMLLVRNAEHCMQRVNAAYAVLSDAATRRDYDSADAPFHHDSAGHAADDDGSEAEEVSEVDSEAEHADFRREEARNKKKNNKKKGDEGDGGKKRKRKPDDDGDDGDGAAPRPDPKDDGYVERRMSLSELYIGVARIEIKLASGGLLAMMVPPRTPPNRMFPTGPRTGVRIVLIDVPGSPFKIDRLCRLVRWVEVDMIDAACGRGNVSVTAPDGSMHTAKLHAPLVHGDEIEFPGAGFDHEPMIGKAHLVLTNLHAAKRNELHTLYTTLTLQSIQ